MGKNYIKNHFTCHGYMEVTTNSKQKSEPILDVIFILSQFIVSLVSNRLKMAGRPR